MTDNPTPAQGDLWQEVQSLEERLAPGYQVLTGDWSELDASGQAVGERLEVFVVGAIKAGKSTLVNSLIGHDATLRGHGVTTFSVGRVGHGEVETARLRFKDQDSLLGQLRFDSRILGLEVEWPTDIYRGEWPQVDLAAPASVIQEPDFIRYARSRLTATLRGLAILRKKDQAVIDQIARDSELVFSGATFAERRPWLQEPDLAQLYREVRLQVPYQSGLDRDVLLYDCQGADSLNPLDLMAVEGVIHHAQLVLYVINSRIGLRDGDQRLLTSLRQRKDGDQFRFVVNVEAFEPQSEDSFTTMLSRVEAGLKSCGFDSPQILPVCALAGLSQELNPQEYESLSMRWQQHDAAEVWQRLNVDRDNLVKTLNDEPRESHEPEAEGLSRLVSVRDKLTGLIGAEAIRRQGQSRDSVDLQAVVAAEERRLHEQCGRMVDELFYDRNLVHARVADFLAADNRNLTRDHPLPQSLLREGRAEDVINHGIQLFNDSWAKLDAQMKLHFIKPLLTQFENLMADSLARLLPSLQRYEPMATATPVPPPFYRILNGRLLDSLRERLYSDRLPDILQPVVVLPPMRHAMVGEYHATSIGRMLWGKISGQSQSADDQRRVHLWERALRSSFRQAKNDAENTISSAKENFKYQYFFRIASELLAEARSEVEQRLDREADRAGALLGGAEKQLDSDTSREVQRLLQRLDQHLQVSSS